jgi:hypothetical protein
MLEWTADDVEWGFLSECKTFDSAYVFVDAMTFKIPVGLSPVHAEAIGMDEPLLACYAKPEDDDYDVLVWCADNCRGRWGAVGEEQWVSITRGEFALIVKFEDQKDAALFRLSFKNAEEFETA